MAQSLSNANRNPVPIQLPVHRQPAINKDSQFNQVWYRWMQALTNFLGNGQGPTVPSATAIALMGLRRS